jgi:hypothetical protein
MYMMLQSILKDTPFASRLVSAGPVLSALRSRKTDGEIARIQAAIDTTEEIVDLITAQIRVGVSEKDIGDFVHDQFKQRGLPAAWSWDGCPIVNSGPNSAVGHGVPSADIKVEPGHIVHIDPPDTIADGARAQHLGALTFALLQRGVTEIVSVEDAMLVACMRRFAQAMKLVVEPTACLGLAAARYAGLPIKGTRIGVIVTGGNIDLPRYLRLLQEA